MEGNGHKKTRKACFIRLYGSLMVLNEPVFGAATGLYRSAYLIDK
jgi:hypothetical protein